MLDEIVLAKMMTAVELEFEKVYIIMIKDMKVTMNIGY